MKIPKYVSLALGVAGAFVVFASSPHAFAVTKTWTGGGSDTNVSTGANWGGVAPSAGDDLVFPMTVTNETVTNDMTAGTSFNSITFNGAAGSTSYTISGNSIALVAGITDSHTGSFALNTLSLPIDFTAPQTISMVNNGDLTLSGVLSGSGNLTFTGGGTIVLKGVNTFTGTASISTPVDVSGSGTLGASSAGTTVDTGGSLNFTLTDKNATIAEPMTFNTGVTGGFGALFVQADCGLSACSDSNMTLSGALTLGADLQVEGSGTINVTGALGGAHTIALASDSDAALVINASPNSSNTPNGTYGAGAGTTTTYADNNPSQTIVITNKNTGIVTGTYGTVEVGSGGTLKGTGSIGALIASAGSHVAPGMSPGCITVTGSLTLNGSLDEELGGTTPCTGYDQLKVTSAATTVDVTGATLNVILYNGFKPAKGQTYTIIDNGSSAKVTGTFTNLAEGATVTVSGYVFKISYVGGDGNDVVLTVQNVPASPNTGFTLMKNNPLATAAFMMTAAGGIAVVAHKNKHAAKRR